MAIGDISVPSSSHHTTYNAAYRSQYQSFNKYTADKEVIDTIRVNSFSHVYTIRPYHRQVKNIYLTAILATMV